MLGEDLFGLVEVGADGRRHQLLFGHRLADRPVELALELQVAVGDDADEPPLPVHDRHAGDLEPPHQLVGFAERPVGQYAELYWERLRALDYDFLEAKPDSAAATALRFTLTVPGVHTAIVGTTKPERWQQNAASLDAGALPRTEFERIRARWREVAKTSWTGQV